MGAFYDEIPENTVDWIKEQHMFWVASAPLAASGSVNVSPKGYDCFNIVSPSAVWYLDCTGSGNETISHLREPGNGRLTIMFSAFTGPPRILRLFGKGRVFERDTPDFDALLPPGDPRRLPGARAIIWLDVDRVGTSMRLLEFFDPKEAADREYLDSQAAAASSSPSSPPRSAPPASSGQPTVAPPSVKNGMLAYWRLKNAESVDGLPGLAAAGFPPMEGAIRKSRRGIQEAYARRRSGGGGAAGGAVALLRGKGEGDWTTAVRESGAAVALLAGLAIGVWVGKEYF